MKNGVDLKIIERDKKEYKSMNIKVIVLTLLVSLVLFSCKESINGPSNGPINAKSLFVGQSYGIPIEISGNIADGQYPQFEKWDYNYFTVYWSLINGSKNNLSLNVSARKVSPGPISTLVSFKYADQIIFQPVNINVMDFYYASSFEDNSADTLELKSGTNFELQVTCKDSQNNPVSINTISRLVGYGYGTNTENVVVYGLYQDTTNFSFLLAALPNITPSSQDTGYYFYLQVSNKEYKLPIKLIK